MYLLLILSVTAVIVYFIAPMLSGMMFGKITSEPLAIWAERTAMLYALLPLAFFLMPDEWRTKTRKAQSPASAAIIFRALAFAIVFGAILMLFTIARFRPLNVYSMLFTGVISLIGVGATKAFSAHILDWNEKLGPIVLCLLFDLFCALPLFANLL